MFFRGFATKATKLTNTTVKRRRKLEESVSFEDVSKQVCWWVLLTTVRVKTAGFRDL